MFTPTSCWFWYIFRGRDLFSFSRWMWQSFDWLLVKPVDRLIGCLGCSCWCFCFVWVRRLWFADLCERVRWRRSLVCWLTLFSRCFVYYFPWVTFFYVGFSFLVLFAGGAKQRDVCIHTTWSILFMLFLLLLLWLLLLFDVCDVLLITCKLFVTTPG